jgi:PTS system mannose-specific IID component
MDKVVDRVKRWDLFLVFWRLLFVQGLLHPKGMQNLGLMSALSPGIGKLQVDGNKPLLLNHLKFFNCNPNFTPLIAGGIIRLEYEREAGKPVTDSDIEYFKKSMSGPMAAMGDLLFLGGLKPLALTLACFFAIYKSLIGLVAVVLVYNLIVVTCRLWGVYFGFAKGWELVDVFSGPAFQRILGLVQNLGAFAGGALVAVILSRMPESGPWVLPLGIVLMVAAVFMLRRDVSSSRLAIFLFPLSILVALLLGLE